MSQFSSTKNYLFILALFGIISESCTSMPANVATTDKFEITDSLLSKLLIDTVKSANNLTDLNFSAKITANEDLQAAIYPMVSGIVGQVN
ncbi:MAG: efflux transporter periplasmic adaptor subunit, partial [Chitinophagaceae bacterium]